MNRYRFIAAERGQYPVRRLCQVLAEPASGYYAWQAGQQRAEGAATPAWETALVKAFRHHKRRYGTRRLPVALRQEGHRVGRQRLRVAMRREGLHALQPKAFTPRTTDSTPGLRCAPNRLPDQPKPTQANRVWVSDITICRSLTARGSYPVGPICAPFRTSAPSTSSAGTWGTRCPKNW